MPPDYARARRHFGRRFEIFSQRSAGAVAARIPNVMDANAHQARLWQLIAARPWATAGSFQPIRAGLRDGFMACPRHRFLHRFRLDVEAELRTVTARTLGGHLPVIYVDAPLIYGAGERAGQPAAASWPGRPAATCSQPSFLFHLLELLDPRPGQRILEIGSGGGWVAGILGHVVGRTGAVTGIEVVAALAAQSRASLARCGVANVAIVAGDGAAAALAGGPFDRILVSAGAGSVPRAWFEALADGGLMVVPLHIPGGSEEVYVLRRAADRLVSEGAVPAWFVPLVGAAAPAAPLDAAADPDLARLTARRPTPRLPAWFGGTGGYFFAARTAAFRSFLYKTEPGFRLIAAPRPAPPAFGLLDRAKTSLALCRPDLIEGYGKPAMLERLMRAYCRWTGRFMPPGTAFALTIAFRGKAARWRWRLDKTPAG
jgi:protein-L-isoaspartate(D-aspartate) O-methyltransferase